MKTDIKTLEWLTRIAEPSNPIGETVEDLRGMHSVTKRVGGLIGTRVFPEIKEGLTKVRDSVNRIEEWRGFMRLRRGREMVGLWSERSRGRTSFGRERRSTRLRGAVGISVSRGIRGGGSRLGLRRPEGILGPGEREKRTVRVSRCRREREAGEESAERESDSRGRRTRSCRSFSRGTRSGAKGRATSTI